MGVKLARGDNESTHVTRQSRKSQKRQTDASTKSSSFWEGDLQVSDF